MKSSIIVLSLVLCVQVGAVRSARASDAGQSSSKAAQELMKADSKFAEDSYKRGAEAWATAWADDGLKPGAKAPLVGKEAVKNQMTPFYAEPANKLTWHPVSAQVAPAGDFGYTWGRWQRTMKNKEGKLTTGEGSYLTVWEKRGDTWQVVYDSGSQDEAAK